MFASLQIPFITMLSVHSTISFLYGLKLVALIILHLESENQAEMERKCSFPRMLITFCFLSSFFPCWRYHFIITARITQKVKTTNDARLMVAEIGAHF